MFPKYLLPSMALLAITGSVMLVSAKSSPPTFQPNQLINRAEFAMWIGGSDPAYTSYRVQKVPLAPVGYVNADDGMSLVTTSPFCPAFHHVRYLKVVYDDACLPAQLYDCQPSQAFVAGHEQGAKEVFELLVPIMVNSLERPAYEQGVSKGWDEAEEAFENQSWNIFGYRFELETLVNLAMLAIGSFTFARALMWLRRRYCK